MHPRRTLTQYALVLAIAIASIMLLAWFDPGRDAASSTPAQVAHIGSALSNQTSPESPANTTDLTPANAPARSLDTASTPAADRRQSVDSSPGVALRVANPYDTWPLSTEAVTNATRAALVNILCTSSGAIHPISGSGVIIDPRGVILTNAHVSQYVLLAQSNHTHLSCSIRTGSPARAAWTAEVLYIPHEWVAAHVQEFNTSYMITGTGEHDYALLLVNASMDDTPLPQHFPYLPIDTREAIGFLGDDVVVASYPAEFLGAAAEHSLYPLASATSIKQLLTFESGSVDLLSVDGVIEAQSGSSGGAMTNYWGHLIGIITTTSAGATVDQREMRALTLSYISRDMAEQTGSSLESFLSGDIYEKATFFNADTAPAMIQQYLARIQSTQQ